ncbi:retrovirus-related Pol polyprotein from transposon TNT 1-94 [Senna tora]|uniref:Retrovirus-related Pol polyprotein from transposon TNT 1-94 n=1 Tax=Senna tora TaxID=362788 RepID=A0A834SSC4_9FABA|nr:retrovirus-related Pol polyprotein from transposon TNT 1-94 [Senna tora]
MKGENYEEWARAVRTALRAKKKHGFVDGSITQPADDSAELEDWWAVNSMLVSWIRNTIEPTLRSTISHRENARDLWEDVRQRFSIANGPRVQQLRANLANCKLNGEPIVTYFGKLKMIWDELGNYEQLPVCTCTGCKCDVAAKLEKKVEEDKAHQFLMGLDEEGYGTMRSNILSTEPLLNLNRVYAMAVQQEQVKIMMRTKEERGNPMSFVMQAGARNSGKNKDKTWTCSNCKREGHDAENCFQLIGYPEWWGNRSRTGGGHDGGRKQGSSGGRGIVRANATQVGGGETDHGVINNNDRKGLSGLNDEQWTTLLGMLNSHKSNTGESDASPHTDLSAMNESSHDDPLDDNEDENTDVGVSASCEEVQQVEGNVVSDVPLGRGQRVRYPSTRLQDYVTHTIKVSPSTSSSLHPSSGTLYPISNFSVLLGNLYIYLALSNEERFCGHLPPLVSGDSRHLLGQLVSMTSFLAFCANYSVRSFTCSRKEPNCYADLDSSAGDSYEGWGRFWHCESFLELIAGRFKFALWVFQNLVFQDWFL